MTEQAKDPRWKASCVKCIHCHALFGTPALAEQHLHPDGSCMTPAQMEQAGLQFPAADKHLQAAPAQGPGARGQYLTKG